jgi:hypothetical protein
MAKRAPTPAALCLIAALALPACGDVGAVTTSTDTTDTTETSGDTGLTPIAEEDMALAIATAYCEQVHSCDCGEYEHASVETCIEARTLAYEQATATAVAAGLSYDGECAAQQVASVEAQGCLQRPLSLDADSCQDVCLIYYGDAPQDEQCIPEPTTKLVQGANCAQSMYCHEVSGGVSYSFCDDPCTGKNEVGPGDACGAEVGLCPDEHWCSNAGTCVPLAGPNEACDDDPYACQGGLVCDSSTDPATCVTAVGEGGACETLGWDDCDRGAELECVDGVCVDREPWICEFQWP